MAKPDKRVPKHLEEYRKERRRVQQTIYRRKKAGYYFDEEDIKLPAFKKTPSKRDVERLKKSFSAEKIGEKAKWTNPETGEELTGRRAQIVKGMVERKKRKAERVGGVSGGPSTAQHGETGRGQGGGAHKKDKNKKEKKKKSPEVNGPEIEGPTETGPQPPGPEEPFEPPVGWDTRPEEPFEPPVGWEKKIYTDPESGKPVTAYVDPETGETVIEPEGEEEDLPRPPEGAPPPNELELVYENFINRLENLNIDPNLHPKQIQRIFEAQQEMLDGVVPFSWETAIRVYQNQEELEAAISVTENYEEGFYMALESFIKIVTGSPVPLDWLAYYEYDRGGFTTYD